MDLKTLNRIDTLRRLRSKGPQTPGWIKPYHLLLFILLVSAVISVLIRIV